MGCLKPDFEYLHPAPCLHDRDGFEELRVQAVFAGSWENQIGGDQEVTEERGLPNWGGGGRGMPSLPPRPPAPSLLLPSFFLASSKACSKLSRASGLGNSKMKDSVPSALVVLSSTLFGGKAMLKDRDCFSDSSRWMAAIRSLITSSRPLGQGQRFSSQGQATTSHMLDNPVHPLASFRGCPNLFCGFRALGCLWPPALPQVLPSR